VKVNDLQPTQMCVGLSEVWSRQQDFHSQSAKDRRRYLRGKPVPLVRNRLGQLWMVDRHHRLRALLELDRSVTSYGYVIDEIDSESRESALEALQNRGCTCLMVVAMDRSLLLTYPTPSSVCRTILTEVWSGNSKKKDSSSHNP